LEDSEAFVSGHTPVLAVPAIGACTVGVKYSEDPPKQGFLCPLL
jgi:hypothetical protein